MWFDPWEQSAPAATTVGAGLQVPMHAVVIAQLFETQSKSMKHAPPSATRPWKVSRHAWMPIICDRLHVSVRTASRQAAAASASNLIFPALASAMTCSNGLDEVERQLALSGAS